MVCPAFRCQSIPVLLLMRAVAYLPLGPQLQRCVKISNMSPRISSRNAISTSALHPGQQRRKCQFEYACFFPPLFTYYCIHRWISIGLSRFILALRRVYTSTGSISTDTLSIAIDFTLPAPDFTSPSPCIPTDTDMPPGAVVVVAGPSTRSVPDVENGPNISPVSKKQGFVV